MITPTQEDFETCQEVLEFILKHTVDNEPHARNYIENIDVFRVYLERGSNIYYLG
jgi:hypothetical protein